MVMGIFEQHFEFFPFKITLYSYQFQQCCFGHFFRDSRDWWHSMGAFRVPDAGLGHGLPRHLEGTPQLWKGETLISKNQ